MPAALTQHITNWQGVYTYLNADMQNFGNHLLDASNQCTALGFAGLANSFDNLLIHWGYIRGHFKFGDPNVSTWMYYAMHWIDDNWPTGGGATMDDILSTMLGASFEQLQKFIGIEDAYRVAIWNAPFNTDFYAALARGFTPWQ